MNKNVNKNGIKKIYIYIILKIKYLNFNHLYLKFSLKI